MSRLDKKDWPRLRASKYRKIEGQNNTWYVPVEGLSSPAEQVIYYTNAADGIHCDTHDPNSDGYGGSVMKFELSNGETDEVKGPWHSSSYGLFPDTGVNVSDLHLNHVTIGTECIGFMEVGGIIYQDPGPVLSSFMRGERIAHQLANLLHKKLYCVRESSGGASAHWVEPGAKLHPMARRSEDG